MKGRIPLSELSNSTNLLSVAAVADQLGCNENSVRNWVRRGYVRAYVVPGQRGVRLDLDEVCSSLAALPLTRVRAGLLAFGPDAQIAILDPDRADDIEAR
ncbi:hypothetical protein [Terrabacter sp. RAF57]|uniref:hypothetical protein n=1 Tax=Terrabacter sp. RAF57 TaxID=3233063 RepID=UPI003F9B95C9